MNSLKVFFFNFMLNVKPDVNTTYFKVSRGNIQINTNGADVLTSATGSLGVMHSTRNG